MLSFLTLPRIRDVFNGAMHIFYPRLCVACGKNMPPSNVCFCFGCRGQLAPTDMHHRKENEFTERFWGILPIQTGSAMYFFHRRSPIQRALHQLKYENKPHIGQQLGREWGRKLLSSSLYGDIDAIVPIPLHPDRERQRGYNQSALFAQGLSEILDVPVADRALRRRQAGASQTRKKRLERFENVSDRFEVNQVHALKGKHILLVDDVLTTGATIGSCGELILALPDTRLSLTTIAIAMR